MGQAKPFTKHRRKYGFQTWFTKLLYVEVVSLITREGKEKGKVALGSRAYRI